MVAIVNKVLALLTVIGDVGIILLAGAFILFATGLSLTFNRWFRNGVAFLASNFMWLALIVATLATFGSLFYSEIAGYEPCKLCWFQRIVMYPQFILLLIAAIKKDQRVVDYILSLSIIGWVIAAYHYLLQIGAVSGFACGTVGYSVSCSQRFVFQFGYVTIVMMSLTAFTLLVALSLVKKFDAKLSPHSSSVPNQ